MLRNLFNKIFTLKSKFCKQSELFYKILRRSEKGAWPGPVCHTYIDIFRIDKHFQKFIFGLGGPVTQPFCDSLFNCRLKGGGAAHQHVGTQFLREREGAEGPCGVWKFFK